MREWTKGIVKKITLEVIYEIVDERTRDIYQKLEKIESRQEEDFRYMNQKIDSQIGQVRQEIGQLRQEIGQLRQEIKEEVGQLRQELNRINQRLDTIMQVLMDIVRK